MLLYIKGTRGYQYFGPANTNSLIEFIENIRMPVIRLTNVDEFFHFILQYEVRECSRLKIRIFVVVFRQVF